MDAASRPLGYTTYHSFTSLNKTGAGVDYFDKLRNALDKLYGADEHHVVLPHVSLALTPGRNRKYITAEENAMNTTLPLLLVLRISSDRLDKRRCV
jgi:hypothetical protein